MRAAAWTAAIVLGVERDGVDIALVCNLVGVVDAGGGPTSLERAGVTSVSVNFCPAYQELVLASTIYEHEEELWTHTRTRDWGRTGSVLEQRYRGSLSQGVGWEEGQDDRLHHGGHVSSCL